QAEPIDGAVPIHQGGGLAIADQGVVFDALCHGSQDLKRGEDGRKPFPSILSSFQVVSKAAAARLQRAATGRDHATVCRPFVRRRKRQAPRTAAPTTTRASEPGSGAVVTKGGGSGMLSWMYRPFNWRLVSAEGLTITSIDLMCARSIGVGKSLKGNRIVAPFE